MDEDYAVKGPRAESVAYLSILVGERRMRAMLKDIVRTRLGVDEPLGGAFVDGEGVHLIIDGKDRLTIPWWFNDNE